MFYEGGGMRIATIVLASILICTAIGVALHQIIVYGEWEWDEMFSANHHEGIALASALIGILIYILPRFRQ